MNTSERTTTVIQTPGGMNRLLARLADAEATYDRVVATNSDAADAGDSSVWHDNFAYEENQRQMHQWARRVKELRDLIARVEVVEPDPAPTTVSIGARVEIVDIDTERRQVFCIAGFDDGDLAEGRLSYNSPLGSALLGATVGEEREVVLAGGLRTVEIVSISSWET